MIYRLTSYDWLIQIDVHVFSTQKLEKDMWTSVTECEKKNTAAVTL